MGWFGIRQALQRRDMASLTSEISVRAPNVRATATQVAVNMMETPDKERALGWVVGWLDELPEDTDESRAMTIVRSALEVAGARLRCARCGSEEVVTTYRRKPICADCARTLEIAAGW